jgi:hypothetical protein
MSRMAIAPIYFLEHSLHAGVWRAFGEEAAPTQKLIRKVFARRQDNVQNRIQIAILGEAQG